MTEDQKYQGALYKDNKKNKKARFDPPTAEQESNHFYPHVPDAPVTAPAPTATPTPKPKMAAVAPAYIEDVPEIESYLVPDDDDNASHDDDAPPHAPTPPPVQADGPVNVFDFLDTSATPNASNLALAQVDAYLEANVSHPEDFGKHQQQQQLVQYDSTQYQTPAPISREKDRKKKDAKDKDGKKRKRLYLEINDQVMTDAPPVLHSGLTGGLSRMSTKSKHGDFPPSPASADTPASPLKKSKSSKHKKRHSSSSDAAGLFSILTAGTKKSKKRKERRSASPEDKKERSRRESKKSKKSDKSDKEPKLLEYHPEGKKEDDDKNQLIVYKPRADLFLSFVNKGPESDRGCSMNKALKRFHRERTASGKGLGKPLEEKELFRSLRLRKNDRGEIVLFVEE